MRSTQMKPWHIGQEVGCINTSGTKGLKENQLYIITDIQQGCCYTKISIGIVLPTATRSYCGICRNIHMLYRGQEFYYKASRFRPLDDISIENAFENELSTTH